MGSRFVVLSGAQVSDSCVGPVYKVGGELASIVLENSNKAHYGYVGHSYVSRWVSIGAGVTISDLKNTCSEVRKTVVEKKLRTGTIKLGLFIGDHTKTTIGVMLHTGLFTGIASHPHGFLLDDVPPSTIYAFTLQLKEELFGENRIFLIPFLFLLFLFLRYTTVVNIHFLSML